MSSMSLNAAKKPALRYDDAKLAIHKTRVIEGKVNAFYRESPHAISSDSGDSSGQNSDCNDNDYQTSAENLQGNRLVKRNSRDEIAEKLSKLKIGCNKNSDPDSGTVDDSRSENDLESHSIIAGNSPAFDIQQTSIQSLPDSRFSVILAGRLDSKDDLYPVEDERSIFNTAINESVETYPETRSNNVELSSFIDSLEIGSQGISLSDVNERDSLEAGDYRVGNKTGNQKAHHFLYDNNNENVDPNMQEPKRRGQLRIISNELVNLPIKLSKSPAKKIPEAPKIGERESSDSVAKLETNNATESSRGSDPSKDRFEDSLMTEAERLVIADIKTPNPKKLLFIEDCYKSSPIVGVNADTFGSEFLTDISNLSALGDAEVERNGRNTGTNVCREQMFKKFSQQFAKAPTEFTKKLVALVDESILMHSKSEYLDNTGVNLSRLTEEFRRMCGDCGEGIKDQSMPSYTSPPPLGGGNTTCEESPASPFHNFGKFGGNKKVYRKTPKRIFQVNSSANCGTPNCKNPFHRPEFDHLYSPATFRSPSGGLDSTEIFETLEKQCTTPLNKPAMYRSSNAESTGTPTYEELIRKSIQQMASLDHSVLDVNSKINEGETLDSDEKNPVTTPKDCRDHRDSIRQKFIENLSSSSLANGCDKSTEHIEQIFTNRLAEKRRKCFEEARKVFENKENTRETVARKSLDKVSGFINNNDAGKDSDGEAKFVSTLSACVDYYDYLKSLQNNKNSLYNILECSEESEQSITKEKTDASKSMKYVEAVILPAQNRARYTTEKPATTSRNVNLIAKTCLYVPGVPRTPNERSSPKSPKGRSRLSPIRKLSPGAQTSTVVSKKIKSPVSSTRRRSVRVVKPASHSTLPRTPSTTPKLYVSGGKQNSLAKSNPRFPSSSELKSAKNSPGLLTDVTNTKKRYEVPKISVTNPSPQCGSQTKSARLNTPIENRDVDCQRQLHFSESDTPEMKGTKYFFTPGKTPTYGKVRPKKKYFETPRGKEMQNKLPANSPGSYRVNYNTVQSPVGMYIRGTDPNLIQNVKGKTNERMLTPRAKTPKSKSKVPSPILARSPCMSPKSTETSRLKFQLTPARKKIGQKESDFLNMALCESNPTSNIGSEGPSHSPFPKIFYKPAPSVKMVKENPPQKRCPNVLARGTEEKIIYRHEGRLKSAKESKRPNLPSDGSSKDTFSGDSGDISILHERPAVKSNYLLKK